MKQAKKILIISPHPDDEAICCGGLIMRAKKTGVRVFVLYVSVGSSRQFVSGTTSAKIRLPEIKHAASYGHFEYSIAYQGKQFMRLDTVPQKDLIEIIEDTTQKEKPDIVCFPSQHSFDQDHRAVFSACITAFRPLPPLVRHQPTTILESEEPYAWGMRALFQPNLYVNISDVFDEKITLLKKHPSQLRADPFSRSPENLERLAGFRGSQIGVRYAEAYNILKDQWI